MNINIFGRFINKIFKQWFIYLGLIPTIYDFFNAYLGFSFKFPRSIIIGFPIAMLIYALYKAYEDEYKEKQELQKKLDGPTNYEITARLSPIDFEEERLFKQLDDAKLEAEKKLSTFPSPLSMNEIDKYADVLYSNHSAYDKTKSSYNQELEQYKEQLLEIIENIDEYKEKILTRVKELRNKFYRIDFFIKNIGITSDGEIQVQIKCLNDNIIFKEMKIFNYGMDLYKLLPRVPEAPKKPKIKDITDILSGSSILSRDPSYMGIADNFNPNAFRKWTEINEKSCSVTIRDLHVGDETNLFNEKLVILLKDKDISFEATIKSKESTRVLHPEVIVEFSENFKENR